MPGNLWICARKKGNERMDQSLSHALGHRSPSGVDSQSSLEPRKLAPASIFNSEFLMRVRSIVDLLIVVFTAIPLPLLPRLGPLHVVNALLVALLPFLYLVLVKAGFA